MPSQPQEDWKNSSPHLLFLSKFLFPTIVSDYFKQEIWGKVFREPMEEVFKRFLVEGIIKPADAKDVLAYKFTLKDLKKISKEKGLRVSGRKEELAEQIFLSDPDGAKKLVDGLKMFQCTKQGSEIAREYLVREQNRRNEAEEKTLQELRERNFKEVSLIVNSFEKEQVFPRGLTIGEAEDEKEYDPARDLEILEIIFSGRPKILSPLDDEKINLLRIGAGMMFLWGTNRAESWLPRDFNIGMIMDNDAAARMILFYAYQQIEMKQYYELGVTTVKISTANDSTVCDACRSLAERKFKLNQMPELPYEKCTSPMGCRCVAIIDEYEN